MLKFSVHTRQGVTMQESVVNLTSVNQTGKFDILQNHANFITLIKDYVILRFPQKLERKIELDTGVLRAQDNTIELYMGINEGVEKS